MLRRDFIPSEPPAGRLAGRGPRWAFTLIELLVVIAIIALLVGILMPSLAKSQAAAKSVKCLCQLRQTGQGTYFYSEDNGEWFPRSQMSASYNGFLPWEKAIIPYLGGESGKVGGLTFTSYLNDFINGLYRCPIDPRPLATESSTEANYKLSYGENGSFELDVNDPLVADYPGKPLTWHRVSQVPSPLTTVFYGELATTAVMNDHFMPYFWHSDANAAKEIDGSRHGTYSNYVFVDGHAEGRPMTKIFKWNTDITQRIDQLNPYLAK